MHNVLESEAALDLFDGNILWGISPIFLGLVALVVFIRSLSFFLRALTFLTINLTAFVNAFRDLVITFKKGKHVKPEDTPEKEVNEASSTVKVSDILKLGKMESDEGISEATKLLVEELKEKAAQNLAHLDVGITDEEITEAQPTRKLMKSGNADDPA